MQHCFLSFSQNEMCLFLPHTYIHVFILYLRSELVVLVAEVEDVEVVVVEIVVVEVVVQLYVFMSIYLVYFHFVTI